MLVPPDSFLGSDSCGLCGKRALNTVVQARQAASAGHTVLAGRNLGRTQLMASAWPSHGLALCPGNRSPVTISALHSEGWKMMCSSLQDAKTLTPPSEAERGSPVPPKCLCLGTSSRGIKEKRHLLHRPSPAPGEPQHSTCCPLPSDHSVTAPAALAPGMSGWRHPSPFSPRRRWQFCDRLCWSRSGVTLSPPSGAAVPARPCRAQAGTSQQEQSRT